MDFADVRAIMAGAGTSLMGQGVASGPGRARTAAHAAISSPLLDIGIDKATGVVWNITGPADMTLFEVRGVKASERAPKHGRVVVWNITGPADMTLFEVRARVGARGAVEGGVQPR